MVKPRCWLCGKEINGNEHFYLVRRRVICLTCATRKNIAGESEDGE